MVDASSLAGVMAASSHSSRSPYESSNDSAPESRLDALTDQPTSLERTRATPTQMETLADTNPVDDESRINATLAGAQGVTALVARESIGAANARNAYEVFMEARDRYERC